MYQYLVDDEDDEIVAMQTKRQTNTIDNRQSCNRLAPDTKSSPLLKHK